MIKSPIYNISKDERVVICIITSKNRRFTGKAICNKDDKSNIEFGKRLSRYRADLLLKKDNLIEARRIKDILQFHVINGHDYTKMWQYYYQDSCKYVKMLEKEIKNLKLLIKEMCK